jgi:hypothetical protein
MGDTAKGRVGESRGEDLQRLAPLFAVSPIRSWHLAPRLILNTDYCSLITLCHAGHDSYR